MNAEISGIFLNGYPNPDYKDKKTGELVQGDYIVQIQQKKVLRNDSIQIEHFDVPVERILEKQYADKKIGDTVKILCDVSGENFAKIIIRKAK